MAETKAPRRLDEALRPGGLYYTADGTAHDAHGNVLEGAPKRPENTKPEDQPHAKMAGMANLGPGGAPSGFDMRQLGMAIAQGLKLGAEGADDPNAPISEAEEQRDELASAAAEAKPAAPEPGKTTTIGDTRVIPSMRPGGEAAAAAGQPLVAGKLPEGQAADTGTDSGDSTANR